MQHSIPRAAWAALAVTSTAPAASAIAPVTTMPTRTRQDRRVGRLNLMQLLLGGEYAGVSGGDGWFRVGRRGRNWESRWCRFVAAVDHSAGRTNGHAPNTSLKST